VPKDVYYYNRTTKSEEVTNKLLEEVHRLRQGIMAHRRNSLRPATTVDCDLWNLLDDEPDPL
jgi:hypothetical protein